MKTASSAVMTITQQAAIVRFFKGSAALYHGFLNASLEQFPRDIDAIETAINAHDLAAVRRHAHNLKSALGMLGFEAIEHQALALELATMEGDAPDAIRAWHSFRADLTQLICFHQRQD